MPKTSYICNCDVIHEDIVNDVKSKMQPKDDYIQLASLFKLFGDGTRVQILHALEQSEMCVCDLAVLLGVTKSAISHQLKALRLANLVCTCRIYHRRISGLPWQEPAEGILVRMSRRLYC